MSNPHSILVAIVSDTHGVLDYRIAELIKQADIAVHAGDIGNADVIHEMQPKKGNVYAVLGNNDVAAKWPTQQHNVLHTLPEQIVVNLPGGELHVVHGHKQTSNATRHKKLRHLYPQARVIVYGHSHRLLLDQSDLPWVINPGAAGKSRTFGGPSCLLLRASHAHWQIDSVRFDK
ncbi:metallophosphoesterase family protein [Kaarinaea lacus]